ncbi:MAG: radical SAM family heme chaperone HemW [Actinobacteria bacterium]|nr:radical SAM family heme chaperone HemW [Actinomycetota bacterium]
MTVELGPGAPRSLYVHVPFCGRRCPYCDFSIHVGGDQLQERFTKAVVQELRALPSDGPPLETIYFGGGTPSRLLPGRLAELLAAVHSRFRVASDAEVTMEANPEDVTVAQARGWSELGFNRLSIGVQSLDDRALAWLGRGHDAAQAEAAVEAAREAGFANLSCDLIYAVPGQTTEVLERGLRRLLAHHPDHISCYELTVEEGTPLQRDIRAGRLPAPKVDDFLEQRRMLGGVLGEAGLELYEVSNYARPGRQSRHNLTYWQGRAYFAVGPGAHGFLGAAEGARCGLEPQGAAVRYWHLRDTATYIRAIEAGRVGWRGHEWLGEPTLAMERLACGLRLSAGTKVTSPEQLRRAHELGRLGLLAIEGHRVRATPRCFEVLHRITLERISA